MTENPFTESINSQIDELARDDDMRGDLLKRRAVLARDAEVEAYAKTEAGRRERLRLRALAQGIAPFVREVAAAAQQVLIERIAELEARLAAIEARPPPLQYQGTWSETKAYNAGSFVTHGGSLWHCSDTNIGVRPGAGSSAWKLAVKKGRGA